jgi:L-threonylcarbamoyladenylate synthase
MAILGNDILEAKKYLADGNLVAIPTETVYGLAANALHAEAVTQIFEVKNRPTFDPLIVHVADLSAAEQYVTAFPKAARLLAEAFWPGPLTLLLPKKSIIPDIVTSGLDTVGIRSPKHPLTQQLLQSIPFPLAAPSANPFGYVSPTTALHVNDQLGSRIPYILDGGECQVGIESTIVGFEGDVPTIYRLGGLRVEDIEEIVGPVNVMIHSTSNPKAPGQLQSHYAPRKKVFLGDIETLLKDFSPLTTGVLSFKKDYGVKHQHILSLQGSVEEAAKNLFTALRAFDQMPINVIVAELLPEEGLGRAINDRLRRAAAIA